MSGHKTISIKKAEYAQLEHINSGNCPTEDKPDKFDANCSRCMRDRDRARRRALAYDLLLDYCQRT